MVFGLGRLGILRGRGKPGAAKQPAATSATSAAQRSRRQETRVGSVADPASAGDNGGLNSRLLRSLPTPGRTKEAVPSCDGPPDAARIAELVAALRQHEGHST